MTGEPFTRTMQNFGWAKIAVYYAPDDPYALFYREVFAHAGLRVETLEHVTGREIGRCQVLVLCGSGKFTHSEAAPIHDWLRKGGALICSGGAWGLEAELGLQAEGRRVSNAVMEPSKTDRLWPEGADRARFFGGELKRRGSSEVIAHVGEYAAITRRKSGKGVAIYMAPNVGQTLRLMQSGRSVECDAIGPSDGSAVLDNGVLRAEDGTALDFDADRCTVSGCPTPFFGFPHSDAVREALIRAILWAVDQKGLTLPMLWHWPNNAKAAAMLTLDCEEFEREHVNQLHRILAMFGTPAAWMVSLPGYSVDVYRAMRAWEHEVGVLFSTDDHSGWHEEKLKIQFTTLSRLTAHGTLMSARPNDGRWRGWNNFYDLCEVTGARVSLSKGGRQPGTSGFLFGTSHPFVPSRWDNSSYLVTEIPYTIFHPGAATPDPVAEKIVYQTGYRYGCVHVACPSDGIATPEVNASLRRVLSICKQQRMEFVLPEAVHKFERGRRHLRVSQKLIEDEGTLLLSSDVAMVGLTVLLTGPWLSAEMRGKEVMVETVERYGCKFNAIQVNLSPKHQIELRLAHEAPAKAA